MSGGAVITAVFVAVAMLISQLWSIASQFMPSRERRRYCQWMSVAYVGAALATVVVYCVLYWYFQ